jgi:fructan beta-fructosidase
MHWGHAVSADLLHWRELPIAIYPQKYGDWAFSGSAIVDKDYLSGFKNGDEDVIVGAYTSTGRGECIVFSNDKGRTFKEFSGNPVLKHAGRDPKLIWYAPGKHWVMAVYDESEKKQWIAFYTSPDLKSWTFQSHIEGWYECPEIFELPVDGKADDTRWVIYAADAKYAVGKFDGKTFLPEHEGKRQVHFGKFYASQTYNNTPDGRRIQIGWAQINTDGMPFNQMMAFPCDLSLRTTEDGIRMFAKPVKEIESLRTKQRMLESGTLKAGESKEIRVANDLLEIQAEFEVGTAKSFGIEVGGVKISYDPAKNTLINMPLTPDAGKIRLQILVDRASVEVCGNDGRVYLTHPLNNSIELKSVKFFSEEQPTKLLKAQVYELKSTWEN